MSLPASFIYYAAMSLIFFVLAVFAGADNPVIYLSGFEPTQCQDLLRGPSSRIGIREFKRMDVREMVRDVHVAAHVVSQTAELRAWENGPPILDQMISTSVFGGLGSKLRILAARAPAELNPFAAELLDVNVKFAALSSLTDTVSTALGRGLVAFLEMIVKLQLSDRESKDQLSRTLAFLNLSAQQSVLGSRRNLPFNLLSRSLSSLRSAIDEDLAGPRVSVVLLGLPLVFDQVVELIPRLTEKQMRMLDDTLAQLIKDEIEPYLLKQRSWHTFQTDFKLMNEIATEIPIGKLPYVRAIFDYFEHRYSGGVEDRTLH